MIGLCQCEELREREEVRRVEQVDELFTLPELTPVPVGDERLLFAVSQVVPGEQIARGPEGEPARDEVDRLSV